MQVTQKRSLIGVIFLCCWMTYLTAYLCRVNFSSALHAITLEKGFSEELLGIVGAVFYGVYACGQLVNGYIGDRVPANRFILIALSGTMLCNLGMAFASAFPLMLLLWGVNGCFQSMFWSTIIRVLAQNIPADKRASISAGISLAMPAAYIVSWGLLGQCLDGAAVKWYFLVPALVCVPLMMAWLLLSGKLSFAVPKTGGEKGGVVSTVQFLVREKLHYLVLVCLFHGLIKEGAAYWTPLLIAGMGFVDVSPYLLATILPAANLIGILLSRLLLTRSGKNPYQILLFLFGCVILVGLGMMLSSSSLLIVGLISLVSGLCYANNTILLSFLPMQYTEKNRVASIIGVFDFASYVGAAISTYVLGKLLSRFGFAPLPGIWMGAAVCALMFTLVMMRRKRAVRGEVRA